MGREGKERRTEVRDEGKGVQWKGEGGKVRGGEGFPLPLTFHSLHPKKLGLRAPM